LFGFLILMPFWTPALNGFILAAVQVVWSLFLWTNSSQCSKIRVSTICRSSA
jgi:hypothetical protein